MQLHTTKGSPNSRKVIAVIEHVQLAVEFEYHDIFSGALRQPSYLAINPNAKVPTLVDGDFVLWESNAIMQYLAQKAGDQQLLPSDARQRADVTRWQLWESTYFNAAFGALAFETVAKPKRGIGAPDDAVISTAMTQLARLAPVLDQHVKGRRYLVGEQLTVADYSMMTFEGYRDITPFEWRPFAHINAYFDRLRDSPAWVRSKARNESLQDAKAA
jgi:glutathione S-transferase